MAEKQKGLVAGNTKRMRGCEGPLEAGSAVLIKEGSESHMESSASCRVRKVQNKEYCAMISSVSPLK